MTQQKFILLTKFLVPYPPPPAPPPPSPIKKPSKPKPASPSPTPTKPKDIITLTGIGLIIMGVSEQFENSKLAGKGGSG